MDYQKEPSQWLKDVYNIKLWSKQEELFDLVVNNRLVSAKVGHGIGGTFSLAALTLWFVANFENAHVFTFAPVWRMNTEILWREIYKLFHSGPMIGELRKTSLLGANKSVASAHGEDCDSIFAFHKGPVLILCDQMSRKDPGHFINMDGFFNDILNNTDLRVVMIGQPNRDKGFFYKSFNKGSGFKTMTISCFDSPNIEINDTNLEMSNKDPLPYPSLVSLDWIKEMHEVYGEEGDFWTTNVLAEFPKRKSPNYYINERGRLAHVAMKG